MIKYTSEINSFIEKITFFELSGLHPNNATKFIRVSGK